MAEGQRTVTLHVVGDKGSGKSLFIRQLATTLPCKKLKFGERCYVVELDLEELTGIPVLVNIREYRNWKFHRTLVALKYHKADAYLLFYDTTTSDRAQSRMWGHYLTPGNAYLVENKCDKIDSGGVSWKLRPPKNHFTVSAKTGHNIRQMLVDVLQQVLGERFEISRSPAQEGVANRSLDHCLGFQIYPVKGVQTYPVKAKAGLCVIVNNYTFFVCSLERLGSDKDVGNIESTFIPLGFEMRLILNKDISTLLREMRHISKLDHTSYSMFVCVIMSHGSENTIMGVDGRTIDIKMLTSLFSAKQCPSLAGKPKLFIIQACQGSEGHPSSTVQADSAIRVNLEKTTVPVFGDFLIAYSTIAGFISYRYADTGSPYIRTLCKTIRDFPENHMIDILTMVNEEVAAFDFEESLKQMPMFQSRLRKHLYLKGPYVTSDCDDIGNGRAYRCEFFRN